MPDEGFPVVFYHVFYFLTVNECPHKLLVRWFMLLDCQHQPLDCCP